MTDRLKRGDYVRVRWNDHDEWTQAFVALASNSDPSSVVLMLINGAVRASGGLCCNVLPLSIDYETETVTSLFGDIYEIEVGEGEL